MARHRLAGGGLHGAAVSRKMQHIVYSEKDNKTSTGYQIYMPMPSCSPTGGPVSLKVIRLRHCSMSRGYWFGGARGRG